MAAEGSENLFQACRTCNLDEFRELSDGMDFSVAHQDIGASCLLKVASNGCQGIVRNILERNPRLAIRTDEEGLSAMHLAARDGKIDVIQELLRKDIQLSLLRDNYGRTPLQLAVVSRTEAAVREFLPGSAWYNKLQFIITGLINIADNDGNTILHHAATENLLEIVEILVEVQGMNVNAVNNQGLTALDILQQPPASPEKNNIIQKLKDRNGDNPISVTPLQQVLMVVAALILTITFQTGLTPPGGFWSDSNGTNKTGHTAGKAIQNTTNPWLLMAFTLSDAIAFTIALALIPAIIILPKKMLTYVNSLLVLALICVEVTFILGLVIVSDFKYVAIEIAVLSLAPCVWIMWQVGKLIWWILWQVGKLIWWILGQWGNSFVGMLSKLREICGSVFNEELFVPPRWW